jgi:hypothetical protein
MVFNGVKSHYKVLFKIIHLSPVNLYTNQHFLSILARTFVYKGLLPRSRAWEARTLTRLGPRAVV